MKYHTTNVMSPPSPNSMLSSDFVFGGLQKQKPFLLMMLGTTDHVVSCGLLFFEEAGVIDR